MKTILSSLVIAHALALVSVPAQAIIDDVPEWTAVQIETVVDGQRVKVSAGVEQGRFSRLSVDLGGKLVHVPLRELHDLPNPRLSTLRVVSPDVKRSPGPHLRLEFNLGSHASNPNNVALVKLHFFELAYQGRVKERDEPNKERVRELKLPGKPPEPLESAVIPSNK